MLKINHIAVFSCNTIPGLKHEKHDRRVIKLGDCVLCNMKSSSFCGCDGVMEWLTVYCEEVCVLSLWTDNGQLLDIWSLTA